MESEKIGTITIVGAGCFGAVIGWVTSGCYVGLATVDLMWVSSLIGVIAGAAVTAIFKKPELFGAYCIGLLMFFPGQFFQGSAGGTIGRNIARRMEWEVREPMPKAASPDPAPKDKK